jgi:hypothetical protein
VKISQRAASLEDIEWLEPFYESIMQPYYVELKLEWDRVPALPGITEGDSKEEVMANLKDAIEG